MIRLQNACWLITIQRLFRDDCAGPENGFVATPPPLKSCAPGQGCGVAAVAVQKAGLLYGGLNFAARGPIFMSVDAATVRRIAHLARIAVTEAEVPHLQGELNAMLAFVEQLSEVNVDGVGPMTSVTPMEMKKRPDVVNDGEIADEVVANAPETQDHFFLVPKVVE
jgi:aspartyl-tRNA(Asn)/glutamyl-tRNA(Gln) amidotransferase subunit C